MEPKVIKEEMIERDPGVLEESSTINNNNNNNNNKESSYRIQTRKSKIKSKEASGFTANASAIESSREQLLSPSLQTAGTVQNDIESEIASPSSENNTFRNHSKLKRFLSTLVQFSVQLSPQISDRVKGQIFNLVNNLISPEEFHHNVQEMTNFPLRPFVLPFLKNHIPSLHRELNSLARNNKQTLQQYLKQHENAYLDRDSQPSEPSEIFHQVEKVQAPPPPSRENNAVASNSCAGSVNSNKRPYQDGNNYFENGCIIDVDYQQPCVKRSNLSYGMPFMYHHHTHLTNQETQHPYNIVPLLHIRGDPEDNKGHVEDEWKNIHVMLNCILSMVEKTKKALGILQERGLAESNLPEWIKKKSTEEMLSQTVRLAEEKIEAVKKRAEESMNDIKHQALAELQKLVLSAESKIIEMMVTEKAKMNAATAAAVAAACNGGSRSLIGSATASQISPSTLMPQYNSCWNCGRKANETCSGCNTAQYCSSFCQHKDWETHHQTCCIHSAAAKGSHKQSISDPCPSNDVSSNRSGFRLSPHDTQVQSASQSTDRSASSCAVTK
ncbi:protein CBFA2T1 isoform X2 [Daktulosphaira vitifoliae]|nr:protein CBFA2T1 isoform X2 [Daktulosphaira vitifoliae]XP_050522891.1 protein CBFA2T1 isoform X2 [Daktulosphaira vitifoliae]XP_050522892.1 protein CBFA2T1 isoform X2 [Daktulosphaira vitifoliae]